MPDPTDSGVAALSFENSSETDLNSSLALEKDTTDRISPFPIGYMQNPRCVARWDNSTLRSHALIHPFCLKPKNRGGQIVDR
jgi:hypothetical protein